MGQNILEEGNIEVLSEEQKEQFRDSYCSNEENAKLFRKLTASALRAYRSAKDEYVKARMRAEVIVNRRFIATFDPANRGAHGRLI